MSIIILSHTKHELIRRADVTRYTRSIAHAIVDRFEEVHVHDALRVAGELERINYHPQTASLIERGNIQTLDKVRELL